MMTVDEAVRMAAERVAARQPLEDVVVAAVDAAAANVPAEDREFFVRELINTLGERIADGLYRADGAAAAE